MTTTKSNFNMKPLADYIYDELNIKPVKTKSLKGYMIYDIPSILDVERLTTLVSQAKEGWSTTYFDAEYDKGRKTKDASIYFGAKRDNGEEKDDFLNS